jgi:hypothetical protein
METGSVPERCARAGASLGVRARHCIFAETVSVPVRGAKAGVFGPEQGALAGAGQGVSRRCILVAGERRC